MRFVGHARSLGLRALVGPLVALVAAACAETAIAEPVYPHRSGALVAWSPAQWDAAWSVAGGTGYQNLDRMKADGFTHVDLQIYNGQSATDEQNSTLVNVLEDPAKRALYVKAIDYAHAIGLKVTLKPHVGGAPQTSSYFPPDPQKFFAAYKSMLDSVALLAHQTRTDMIVIGTELGAKLSSSYWKDRGYTSFDVTDWWRTTMIPSVRAKAPNAKLTYAATCSPHLHTDINANEAPYVTFWDLLDHIGLNGYFNMNDIALRLNKDPEAITEDDFYASMHNNGRPWTGENSYINPVFSIASLKAKYTTSTANQHQMRYFRHIAEGVTKLYGAAGTLRRSATLAPQAIFTEWGVPGAESSLDYWAENQKTVASWERQRRGYAASMREFTEQMQAGAGTWFSGTVIWQILPWHNPASTTSPQSWVAEFDPIGKPAEAVIRQAYTTGMPSAPPAVPAAPTGLVATAGDARVALRWNASVAATGYDVYRASGTGALAKVGAASPTTTATTFTDTGLTNGTQYTYAVRAINSAGASGNSSTVTATPAAATAPTARTVTVIAEADVHVRQAAPTTVHGSATRLRVDLDDMGTAGSQARAYVRFNVPALAAGERIQSARLSLVVADETSNGPGVWRTGTSWTESTTTWNSGRPARVGTAAVGNFASMPLGRQSVPVSGVTSSGRVSFELMPEATNLLMFASREDATTANRPQLVLAIATG